MKSNTKNPLGKIIKDLRREKRPYKVKNIETKRIYSKRKRLTTQITLVKTQ